MIKNMYISIEAEFDKPIIGFVKSDKYNESQSKRKRNRTNNR